MALTVVFANQKGGVGKTTSAVNLGAYLAQSGKRVLLVDFDPQGNLSSSVGADRSGTTVYDLISKKSSIHATIQKTLIEKLFIIPADMNLSGATVELVDEERREFFLKDSLAAIANAYDFVLIDCPPSLGILTINGLTAADEVMIPLQTEYFALEGLAQLMDSIRLIQRTSNPKLRVGGIFFTMYDSRTRLAQDVVREVVQHFGKTVFRTIIPRNVRLSEAPSHGLPISHFDPACIGAKSYAELAEEVMARG